MQAIILAAGMGKRLGDLTKDNTKCMIKVNGTYLIDRLLSQLDSLNLERIILVIGYQGEKLRTHIEKQSRNTPIEYIYNPIRPIISILSILLKRNCKSKILY